MTATISLSPEQLEVVKQALRIYAEQMYTSLREGTYSEVITNRLMIATTVQKLLLDLRL